MRRITLAAIFFLLLVGLLISTFEVRLVKTGSTIIVPDDYLTIQEAIDAASDGDTIFVRNGTYFGGLIIEKELVLIGESKYETIINASAWEAVTLIASNITIANFTITAKELGVHFREGNYSILENCQISGRGIAESYWGIYLSDDSHNNTVTRNLVEDFGTGIFLESSSYNKIIQNTVVDSHYGIRLKSIITVPVLPPPPPIPPCMYNIIYHNAFIGNYIQASDQSVQTTWNNGSVGNFWSTYNGADLNDDGIGDTSLPCEGVEYYPLMKPISWWNLADVNYDWLVNINDVVLAASAYLTTHLDSDWNCHCDLAEPYGIINIFDIVMICSSYGEEYTP